MHIINNEMGEYLSEAEYEFLTQLFLARKTHFEQSFKDWHPLTDKDFNEESEDDKLVAEELVRKPKTTNYVFTKMT